MRDVGQAHIEELETKLTKALDALDEAVYLLAPDEEDIMRKAGVYRVVSTLKELKGYGPEPHELDVSHILALITEDQSDE